MPKNKTFADRARQITNKYKKRLGDDFRKFDPIAKESMNLELDALKQEQEQYKLDNGLLEQENPMFKSGGGLSRKEDYGSKANPYPSVKSKDFAGKNRSYPIPTKAD